MTFFSIRRITSLLAFLWNKKFTLTVCIKSVHQKALIKRCHHNNSSILKRWTLSRTPCVWQYTFRQGRIDIVRIVQKSLKCFWQKLSGYNSKITGDLRNQRCIFGDIEWRTQPTISARRNVQSVALCGRNAVYTIGSAQVTPVTLVSPREIIESWLLHL